MEVAAAATAVAASEVAVAAVAAVVAALAVAAVAAVVAAALVAVDPPETVLVAFVESSVVLESFALDNLDP